MNYIVITEMSLVELKNAVNKAIKEGYKPLGGIAVDNGTKYQAMIKE